METGRREQVEGYFTYYLTQERRANREHAVIADYSNEGPKNVLIPSVLGGYPVATIGGNAFSYRELTSVVIPEGVKEIEEEAFEGNNLESVTLPDSLTTIKHRAFFKNMLKSLEIPQNITRIYPLVFGSNQLGSLVIPNRVRVIGENAFADNALTTVLIPDSVFRICAGAFALNPLTSIVIPECSPKWPHIHIDAFEDKVKIERRELQRDPNESKSLLSSSLVESFGWDLYYEGLDTYDGHFAYDISYDRATIKRYHKNSPRDVILPRYFKGYDVTAIADNVFADMQITSVTFPETMTVIGRRAFSNNQLKTIVIPESVRELGHGAFRNNRLSEVTILAGKEYIGGLRTAFQMNQEKPEDLVIVAEPETRGHKFAIENGHTFRSIKN